MLVYNKRNPWIAKPYISIKDLLVYTKLKSLDDVCLNFLEYLEKVKTTSKICKNICIECDAGKVNK